MPILGIMASQISGHLAPPPVFQGDYWALGTVTVPSGGASSITLTGIPQNYTHLQIRGLKKNGSGGWITGRLNDDAANKYTYHELRGDGSSVTANASSGSYGDVMYMSLTENTVGSMIVDILDYSNNNKYKTVRTFSGSDANGAGYVQLVSNLYASFDAVNSITFYTSFQEYSSFAVYGVK